MDPRAPLPCEPCQSAPTDEAMLPEGLGATWRPGSKPAAGRPLGVPPEARDREGASLDPAPPPLAPRWEGRRFFEPERSLGECAGRGMPAAAAPGMSRKPV